MKKIKLSIFINIAIICLCLCAIAFGVYSAKNANLNVSGTVGFNSHNCDVDVTAYIYGDSAVEDTSTANASESGVVRSEKNKKVLGSAQVKGDSDKTISLGNIYFCDMTADDTMAPIYIVFELTNQSIFNVDISATTTFTPANENITATNSGVVTLKDKSAQSTDKKKELIVTLTLKNNSIDFNNTNISIKLNMYKSESFTYNTIAEKNYHDFKIQKRELFDLYQNFENSADYKLDNFLNDLNQNKSAFDSTGFASIYNTLYESNSEKIIDPLTVLSTDSIYYKSQGSEENIPMLYYQDGQTPVKNNDTYSFTLCCGSIGSLEGNALILSLNLKTYAFELYQIPSENCDTRNATIKLTDYKAMPSICTILWCESTANISSAKVKLNEFRTQKTELYNIYQTSKTLSVLLENLNQNQSLFNNTNFDSLYTKLHNSQYEFASALSVLNTDSTYSEGQSTESGPINLYYEEGSYPVKNGDSYSITLYCELVKDLEKCAILALNFETYNFVLYEISGENFDFQYGKITITNCSYLPFVCMVLAY